VKTLGLAGLLGGGSPCAVDVKNGKIIRVRPLHYDWKYDKRVSAAGNSRGTVKLWNRL